MSDLDLASRIALPSRIGQTIGQQVWGEPYIVFPWIAYMEQRIVEAILDTTHERYLIINAPPQSGKSSYVGMLLPFWITGMFPSWQVMYISYSDDFSVARGKDVRTFHQLYGRDLFGSSIDPDFSSAADWRVVGGRGGMLSVGIGGLITGRPGNVIVLDDLLKNALEARSKATKSSHLSEWDGTIHTRLQPGGTVIIIATRQAEDDLTGSLVARMDEPGYDGPQWEVLEFPAFAEPSDREERGVEDIDAWRDILGRSVGEVLDCRFSRVPGREPADFFNMKKASTDALAWSALYQQKPSSREGGMFPVENWQYYEPGEEPAPDKEVRVWDLAATEGGGDWTAGVKMARCGDKFYVLDVRRFRKNAGGVQDEVLRCAGIDGFGVKIMIEEERGGSGKSVTEAFRRLLVGHTVEPAKAEGSKESRATPYSAEQHKRRVFLPRPGSVSWDVNAFIDEHKRMMGDGRRGAHDDMVDTAAYAMLDLLGSGIVEMWVPNQSNWMSPEAQMNALIGQSPYL